MPDDEYRGSIGSDTFSARDLSNRRLAGRYHLHHRLAVGGMAEVWEADDTVLSRRVAVKIPHAHLLEDAAALSRFRSEAVAAARLSHPNVVAVYDTCSEPDGVEAIVMELVRGVTLREWLDRYGPLQTSRVLDLGIAVADALDAAHRTGLIHRDIKPANILLCDDRRVKVTDFGVAKAFQGGQDHTSDGLVVGTARYLAPEQVEGRPLDPRTDLYALGLVLYEALVGHLPFGGDSDAAVALARLQHDPVPPSAVRTDVPASLEQIVMRSLARDPDERWPTCRDLAAALSSVADSARADGRPPLATSAMPAPLPPSTAHIAGAAHTTVGPQTDTGALNPALEGSTPASGGAHRGWVVPTIGVSIVVVCLGLVAALVGGTSTGRRAVDRISDALTGTDAGNDEPATGANTPANNPTSGPDAPAGLIDTATAFDPFGTFGEHDAEAPLAIDGDLSTAWSTERYNSPLGDLKPGVGIHLVLNEPARLDALIVETDARGWAAQVYVADAPGETLEDWGEPLDERDGLDGRSRFDLDNREASAVLLWITDLGNGETTYELAVNELIVEVDD